METMARLMMLLSFAGLVLPLAANECTDNEIRLVTSTNNDGRTYPQYCLGGVWRLSCGRELTDLEAGVACRQLGYSGGSTEGRLNMPRCNNLQQTTKYFDIEEDSCHDDYNHLSQCEIQRLDSCDCDMDNRPTRIECTSDCTHGDVRLVDGSRAGEGRVEVCVEGHWGTVCNNTGQTQEIADIACTSQGYPAEGARIQSALPGIVPIQECRGLENNRNIFQCTQVTDSFCDHSMDLGVHCLTLQEVLEPRIKKEVRNALQNCSRQVVTLCPTTSIQASLKKIEVIQTSITTGSIDKAITRDGGQKIPTMATTSPTQGSSNTQSNTGQCSDGALGALLGVLVAVTIGLTIGWIMTCWVSLRRKQQLKQTEISNKQAPGPQVELHNPTYDANSSGPAEVCETNEYSSRGPAYERVDNNTEYCSLQHNNRVPMQITTSPATPGAENHVYGELEAGDYEVPRQSKLFETDPRSAGDVENNYHVVSLAGGEDSAAEHVYGELEAEDYEVPRQSKLFNTTHNEDYSTLRH